MGPTQSLTAGVLLEQLPLGIIVLAAKRDEAFRVVDFECEEINRQAGEGLGIRPERLLGRRLGELAPERYDRSQLMRLEQALHRQQPTPIHLPSFKEALSEIEVNAVGLGDRLVLSFVSAGEGVAKRERSVDIPNLYGPDSGLLELILDFLPNPAFAKDKEHRWIFGNEEFSKLVGVSSERLLGKSDYDFFPRHQADVFWRKDEEVFAGDGQVVENEEAITDASGKERWLLTRKVAKQGPLDEPVLLAVIADITARKDAERALIESVNQRDHAILANQAKSTFLTRMSHELRTPLNAIIGYSELIREEASESGCEMISKDIERVLISAQHLLAMVSDALDLAKIERGGLRFEPATFEVGLLMDELERRVHAMTALSHNRFELCYEGEATATMNTDRPKLEGALLHLLQNADKFTSHGCVKLIIERQEAGWRFVVEDEGPGIDASRLEHIFDAFYQGVDASAPHRGMGLGLPIVRAYVSCIGGQVGVESELWRGSRFWVTVPDAA